MSDVLANVKRLWKPGSRYVSSSFSVRSLTSHTWFLHLCLGSSFQQEQLCFYNTCIPRLSKRIQKVMMLFTPSCQDVPLWSQRWKTQGQVESEQVKVTFMSEYAGCQCGAWVPVSGLVYLMKQLLCRHTSNAGSRHYSLFVILAGRPVSLIHRICLVTSGFLHS